MKGGPVRRALGICSFISPVEQHFQVGVTVIIISITPTVSRRRLTFREVEQVVHTHRAAALRSDSEAHAVPATGPRAGAKPAGLPTGAAALRGALQTGFPRTPRRLHGPAHAYRGNAHFHPWGDFKIRTLRNKDEPKEAARSSVFFDFDDKSRDTFL